jgi:hypothetical protein
MGLLIWQKQWFIEYRELCKYVTFTHSVVNPQKDIDKKQKVSFFHTYLIVVFTGLNCLDRHEVMNVGANKSRGREERNTQESIFFYFRKRPSDFKPRLAFSVLLATQPCHSTNDTLLE